MSTETIDSEELSALRQQAAEAIPYKSEAERLARALWEEDQRHPAIVGELWNPLIEKWDEALLNDQGFEPVTHEIDNAINGGPLHE